MDNHRNKVFEEMVVYEYWSNYTPNNKVFQEHSFWELLKYLYNDNNLVSSELEIWEYLLVYNMMNTQGFEENSTHE